MAAPGGKFFIQDKLSQKAAHHESYAQLWETKWKKPVRRPPPSCSLSLPHTSQAEMGVYPFMFGTAADFEPIVSTLVAKDMREPYDWDAYAAEYFPQAEKLAGIAEAAEAKGEQEKASEYWLRASAVYRISRFPAPRSEVQREAWTKGKECCIRGLG